ncbi:cell wall integrity and stress response component 4-like isoform X2 [Lates japonicus]|uniref:Cell wall integrity and stress response component 4-like isoform X2 n=1 Tax=Lates japonicus TaxID=270547 RepID=A0AAD3RFC2_LATJO|nr:cell wall integrity and stress response component 4-like isoform X2 [Lates japonicus]
MSTSVHETSLPPVFTGSTESSTTTASTPVEPKITLEFKIQENFTTQLGNKSSPEYKELKTKVTTTLNKVYSSQYGARFNRTVVNGFSKGSIMIDAELIFNDVNSLPNASSVAETLVAAASSSNFSLSVNTSSIIVSIVLSPTQAPATTSFSTSITTSPHIVTSSPLHESAPPVMMTSPPTGSIMTTSPTVHTTQPTLNTTPSLPGNVTVPQVTATSSAPTIAITTTVLEATTIATSPPEAKIKSGSVVVDMTLVFKDENSVPSASNATSEFSSGLSNSTSLNVISGSVSATSSSSAASTTVPNVTASLTAAPATASNATSAPTAAPTAASNVTAAPTAASTAAPASSTTTASTDPPTSSEGTLGLTFSLNQTFTSDLSNSSSTAFKSLAATVVKEVNKVGQKVYGSSYSRSIVNKFTSGSVDVDMTLVFTNENSVPSASNATSEFSRGLSNFPSLNVISSSVSATSFSSAASTAAPNVTVTLTAVPTAAPTATAASTAAPTAAPTTTAVPTTAPTAISSSTTTATTTNIETTTTASTNPPTSSEGTLGLQFSLNQTFTSDLSNSSTTTYQTLSMTVVSEVNKVCRRVYSSTFRRSIVNMFRRGSVVVDMTLVFKDKSSVPTTSNATAQLSSELTSNSTSLNIIPGSVTAHTSTSSSPPRPSVLSLAVLSLTLLAVAQMLTGL